MLDRNTLKNQTRPRKNNRPFVVGAATTVFTLLLGAVWLTKPHPVQGEQAPGATPPAAKDGDLSQRFARDIWPLLTRADANCVACHGKNNPSQLHFPADAESSYRQLLAEGRFDPHNPSSLLARIAATDPGQQMPPTGMHAWSDADKAQLKAFMDAVTQSTAEADTHGPRPDEQFPPALLLAYTGPKRVDGLDNTFLSYYQLRHKIATLFGDDWRRGGQDRYIQNLAQLGGADFVTRFDESTRPTPSYLSAVGELAADASSRAYLAKTGPFAGRPDVLPLPGAGSQKPVRDQINRLFGRLLFRAPSAEEMGRSVTFLHSVAAAQTAHAQKAGPLMFQVVVSSPDGEEAIQQAEIAVFAP